MCWTQRFASRVCLGLTVNVRRQKKRAESFLFCKPCIRASSSCKSRVVLSVLNATKAMYPSVLSCVRVNDKVTGYLWCPFGVKQGFILSPGLSSLEAQYSTTEHSSQLQSTVVNYRAQYSTTDWFSWTILAAVCELHHLNSLCKEHSLYINTKKSKVVVFRKDGFLSKNGKWLLAESELSSVQCSPLTD